MLKLKLDKYNRLNWEHLESQEIRGKKRPSSEGSCSYAWQEKPESLEEMMEGAVSAVTVAVQEKDFLAVSWLLCWISHLIALRSEGRTLQESHFSLAWADFTSFVSVVAWRMEFVPLLPCNSAADTGNPASLRQHEPCSCFREHQELLSHEETPPCP